MMFRFRPLLWDNLENTSVHERRKREVRPAFVLPLTLSPTHCNGMHEPSLVQRNCVCALQVDDDDDPDPDPDVPVPVPLGGPTGEPLPLTTSVKGRVVRNR